MTSTEAEMCLSAIRIKKTFGLTKTIGETLMWNNFSVFLDRNATLRCTGFLGFRGLVTVGKWDSKWLGPAKGDAMMGTNAAV